MPSIKARWRLLLPILVVAVLMRIGYMPGIGQAFDLNIYRDWGQIVFRGGLFNVYRLALPDYPPLYLAMLGVVAEIQVVCGGSLNLPADPTYVALLKLFPVLAELVIIVAVYAWLRRERVLRWLIPLSLAVSPALIADSAWWGQTDSLMTLFLVLALIALNRDRPWPAWVFFSIAILTKFQSVPLLPLMIVLTFRRYGLRAAVVGLATSGIIATLAFVPFFVNSSIDRTLRPYLGAVDGAPYLTINAFNFWYAATPEREHVAPFPSIPALSDQQIVLGPLTYKQLGLVMLAVYTLLISVSMWRWHGEKREFIWAAALYFGFFMLPTQIHERYLYPVAVLSVIGIAQGIGMWVVALGVNYTVAQNILALAQPMNWLGIPQLPYWPKDVSLYVALLNCALIIEAARFAVRSPARSSVCRALRSITIGRLSAVFVIASLLIAVNVRLNSYTTAGWMAEHIASSSRLAFEWPAEDAQKFTSSLSTGATWQWLVANRIEDKPVFEWLAEGAHYLLIDERTPVNESFDQRLQKLVDQGATLLYETSGLLTFGARQAVLWTFRPQHVLNLTFDNSLTLIGYNVIEAQGGKKSLLFHWYTSKTTGADYQLFIHLVDSGTGNLIGQTDSALGKGVHPTSTWRRNEIIFETFDLPSITTQLPYHIQIGLYELSPSRRALATDDQGRVVGDSVQIVDH